jgi:hypothetical protein
MPFIAKKTGRIANTFLHENHSTVQTMIER